MGYRVQQEAPGHPDRTFGQEGDGVEHLLPDAGCGRTAPDIIDIQGRCGSNMPRKGAPGPDSLYEEGAELAKQFYPNLAKLGL